MAACEHCGCAFGGHAIDCPDHCERVYRRADLDRAVVEEVAKEREAIMQILETRRARHGTGCDCKSFDTLGVMLDEIRASGKEGK